MSISVGAIGAVTNSESVYAALSPYLNGVVRTSDAATLAQADAASRAADVAVAQTAVATGAAAAAVETPFANPAITAIGERLAVSDALNGDSGLLVQSYGAVALIAGVQVAPPIYGLPSIPAIPPVAKPVALPSVRKVA